MSFHAASDEGIFAEDVLEARKQREEESRQVICRKIQTDNIRITASVTIVVLLPASASLDCHCLVST